MSHETDIPLRETIPESLKGRVLSVWRRSGSTAVSDRRPLQSGRPLRQQIDLAGMNIELDQAAIERRSAHSQPFGGFGSIAFGIGESSKQFGFLILAR